MWDTAACARIGSDLRGVRDWRRTPCPRERRIVVLCANRVRAAGGTVAPVRIGHNGVDCLMFAAPCHDYTGAAVSRSAVNTTLCSIASSLASSVAPSMAGRFGFTRYWAICSAVLWPSATALVIHSIPSALFASTPLPTMWQRPSWCMASEVCFAASVRAV